MNDATSTFECEENTTEAPCSVDIPIGGITPLSTVDFPGMLSVVVFLRGCPWRCPYCHNTSLLSPHSQAGDISWSALRAFLKKRRGFLEGVVFSGGEPTLHQTLPEALREVRRLGYKTGLHTAGAYPRRLAKLLPLLDWVGLDIKAPLDARYDRITGWRLSSKPVRQSLSLLMISGKDFQLRTTRDTSVLNEGDCTDLQSELRALGAPATHWQEVRKN